MHQSIFSHSAGRGLLIAALLLGSAQAGATQLIQNGGFEADASVTYAPSNWLVAESGGIGGVAAVTKAFAESSTAYASAGPASGSYFAQIDVFTAGAYTLAQSFTTAAVSQATLNFKMFINDQSPNGVTYPSNSLNYDYDTNGNRDVHYARIDILRGGADAFSSNNADVLQSLFIGSSGAFTTSSNAIVESLYIGGATGRYYGSMSNGYVNFSYDLTDALAAGGNYTLRFAAASNVGQMQVGVDDVSLQVTAVPEPESYALMLAGLGILGGIARRRSRA